MCPLTATSTLADLDSADVVVVPGRDWPSNPDPALVEWLSLVHPTTTWTLSDGAGSSYLAAAGALDGPLDGAAAATHRACVQRLSDAGVTYSDQRVVRAGKVLTSAGATASIDLALTLLDLSHGPAVAQAVQLALEYDPQRPTTPAPRRGRPPRSASS